MYYHSSMRAQPVKVCTANYKLEVDAEEVFNDVHLRVVFVQEEPKRRPPAQLTDFVNSLHDNTGYGTKAANIHYP